METNKARGRRVRGLKAKLRSLRKRDRMLDRKINAAERRVRRIEKKRDAAKTDRGYEQAQRMEARMDDILGKLYSRSIENMDELALTEEEFRVARLTKRTLFEEFKGNRSLLRKAYRKLGWLKQQAALDRWDSIRDEAADKDEVLVSELELRGFDVAVNC